jgi:hypothetical protein
MSDLIEKALRHMNDPHARYSMKDRFDHAQLFTDEIERLRVERRTLPEYDDAIQAISKENLRLESENAKLQAVVDLLEVFQKHLQYALAALESDDG